MPGSIVARTTLSILALSLLLGLLFAIFASLRTQSNEESRLRLHLQELLSTVESTTQIACFLGDSTLASEIAQGLLRNHAVVGARIVAGGKILYESPHAFSNVANSADIKMISRSIYSPFNATDRVGEITLATSATEIRAQAQHYSWNTALVLGLQVAFVAAGVALVVFLLITRPIRGISNELHRLQLSTGMQLQIPRNRSDEIGRLVLDVNALITSLTSLLDSERELRLMHEIQKRKMKLIVDKAVAGIFVLEAGGVLQFWNPAFLRIVGVSEHIMAGSPQRLQDLLVPHGPHVDALIQRCLSSGEPCDMDLDISRDGALRSEWIELSIDRIGPTELQGVINDVTERKRNELSAQRIATHDTLTGLLNRHGVATTLAGLFSHSSAERLSQLALLQIDLDYFKQVNDTYGHAAGDRVLCQVARMLESTVRRSDFVGRVGGDEFMAALVGIDASAKAQQIAEGMIAAINQPIDIGAGNYARVSASIGIAFPSGNGETPEAVLSRADAAMYAAKQGGRSRACVAPLPSDADLSTMATRGAV